MGADAPGKQELAADVFARAARCVVDSRSQCVHHGDSHFAVALGTLAESELVELGQVIDDPGLGRVDEDAVTVADLTGVGVQDLQIANFGIRRRFSEQLFWGVPVDFPKRRAWVTKEE